MDLSKGFIKYFGGIDTDAAAEVQQTGDGGYIIIGTTHSYGAGASDMYVIKTDGSGNEIWNKTFGDSLADEGASVKQTPDGGYIFLGTFMDSTGLTDVYAIKTDGNGTVSWANKYGNLNYNERGFFVSNTYDNGFIILSSTNNDSLNRMDLYAIKIDGLGALTMVPFKYGAKGVDDFPSNVIPQYVNGSYVMSSSTIIASNPTPRLVGFRENAGALTFNNAPINSSWGEATLVTAGYVSQTRDGGYILIGTNSSNDIYLLKLDASMNKIWSSPVVYSRPGMDEGRCVQATSDGGYIILGTTSSGGAGLRDILLIKTDSNGQEEWSKTFGGAGHDEGRSVQQTSDGGYIILGVVEFGDDITNKDNIICLIKTNDKGEITNSK